MLGSCLSDVYASILITTCSTDPLNLERAQQEERVRTARTDIRNGFLRRLNKVQLVEKMSEGYATDVYKIQTGM